MNRLRLFFIFLFHFLTGITFSQEINGSDLGFVVEGEQFSLVPYRFGFAVLTPDGYYDADGNFFNYSKPYPEELKQVNINNLSSAQRNNITYVLYPGGGMLFSFREGALIREDLSYAHSNYYGSYFFSHDNALYVLGGYGLWTTKKDLLRFNFEFKEWEKVEVTGTYPKEGFWELQTVLHEDKLYVVFGAKMITATQERSPLDKMYVLDLQNKVWKPQYEIPKRLLDRMIGNRIYGVQNGNTWVLFPADNARNYTLIDPVEGKVFISPEKDFYVSAFPPLFLDNQMITLRRLLQSSPNFEVKIYPYAPTEYTEQFALNRPNSMRNRLLLLGGGLLFLLFLLWRFILKAQTYTLSKDRIGKRMRWVSLDSGEYYLLRKIAQYGSIRNNEIVHFFSEDGKSQDLFVKRKNAMVKNLELKLQAKFKQRFFIKVEDPNDKRFYNYSIAPKIIIKYS